MFFSDPVTCCVFTCSAFTNTIKAKNIKKATSKRKYQILNPLKKRIDILVPLRKQFGSFGCVSFDFRPPKDVSTRAYESANLGFASLTVTQMTTPIGARDAFEHLFIYFRFLRRVKKFERILAVSRINVWLRLPNVAFPLLTVDGLNLNGVKSWQFLMWFLLRFLYDSFLDHGNENCCKLPPLEID